MVCGMASSLSVTTYDQSTSIDTTVHESERAPGPVSGIAPKCNMLQFKCYCRRSPLFSTLKSQNPLQFERPAPKHISLLRLVERMRHIGDGAG